MKNRVIWKMFALTILTLGIYRLYWFIKTRQEIMAKYPSVKILSPALFVIPVIAVMLAIGYFAVSIINSANTLPSYCEEYSYSSDGSNTNRYLPEECQVDSEALPIIILYAAFFIIWPLAIVWLWSYSKAVDNITKGKTSFAIAMIVLLAVPDGLDILIIQDSYNKLAPTT